MSKKTKQPKNKGTGSQSPRKWTALARQSALVIFGLFVVMAGLEAVEERVHENPRYLLEPQNLQLEGLSEWMVASEKLTASIQFPFDQATIFKQSLESDIQQALQETAWVKEVIGIRKSLPNDLQVSLVPRRPVARVRQGLNRYLIDIEGVRLPESLYNVSGPLPLIEGVNTRLPLPGNVWNSENIRETLALLKKWHEKGIETKYPTMKIMKITCATGKEIAVGKPHITLQVSRRLRLYLNTGYGEGDISVNEALDNLEKILFRDPHLRYLHSYIDLRWSNPTLQ